MKTFRAKGVEPEGYVLYTYAAFQAWKQAVEKAGSTDTDKVIKAMNGTEFNTVIGKLHLQREGRSEPAALRCLSLEERQLRAALSFVGFR